MHRLIAILLLIILLLPASPARADDPYEEISASAQAISPASFDSVRQGIEQLAVSGDPRAAVVIGALHDGMSKAAVCRNFAVKRTTLIETLARVSGRASG